VALCTGCGPKEPVAQRKSIREIDAEIKRVQADVNMPSQAKSMALGALQREHEIAAKSATGRR
jgi:hypothetical protein